MQGWQTLVDADALLAVLAGPDVRVVDCRFSLTDPADGEAAYLEAHLPSAHYAHLDRDLSAPSGEGGRHPLPSPERFAAWLGELGIGPGVQVVVYDDGIGAFAARLWWMLRWLGHEHVALLNGGLQAWQACGGTLESGPVAAPARCEFTPQPSEFKTRDLSAVVALSAAGGSSLIDARDGPRYRGEVEPFAPVAGHVPGAASRPFKSNCGDDNCFKPAATLQAEWEALGDAPKVCYCGSGVTACHNILAAVHAGYAPPDLFVGSWSQWVLDSALPVATGTG